MSDIPDDSVENMIKKEDTMENEELHEVEVANETEKENANKRIAHLDLDSEDPLVEYEKIVLHRFLTEDEAYQFFLDYSKKRGFSIRKDILKYNTEGNLVLRRFVCSYAGFKKHRETLKRKPRESRRVGCPVLLTIKYDFGACSWYVHNFIDEHNHMLATTKEEAAQLRSHRKIPEAHKTLFLSMERSQ